ncbi:MAG TPA: hypothetical protein PLU10_13590, partial [Chitinophagaceae bacterium]|nr:hypothetical protein [Chitinophagaceae bacterium]
MNVRLFFLIIFFPLIINAQSKRANNWVTGYSGNEIHFKVNGITTSIGQNSLKYFTAGNSCISDTGGNLILLSNGFHVLS